MRPTAMTGVMMRRRPSWHAITLEEVATRCGLHPRVVEHFVALGLIDPLEGESHRFPPEVAPRLQRILRLRRDLGLSYNGAGLVVELLDRIEALEQRLNQLQSIHS